MADQLYSYQRWKIAKRLKRLKPRGQQNCIEALAFNVTVNIERKADGRVVCRILGRTASSTRRHVDWFATFAVKNWIKACLKKDAPEGGA